MSEPCIANPTALTIYRFKAICTWRKTQKYSMMIKLIKGSLTEMDHWHSIFNKDKQIYDNNSGEIPTMVSIAANIAWEDGTQLDLKQVITYESICSTFLLRLVNADENQSTSIGSYFENTAPSNSSTHAADFKHNFSSASSSDSTNSNLSYNSDESSFVTNSSFSDRGNQSSLASKSQDSPTKSDCSLL